MPSLSQHQRRRALRNEHEDEPPRRRRRSPVEEEEEVEEEGEEEEGDYDVQEEEYEEEAEEAPRSRKKRQSQGQRRRQKASGRRGQDDSDVDSDGEDDGAQVQASRQKLYQELLSKKLVRYALSCEPRRVPIRRQAVKEQVLDNQGKHFRNVFPIAQEQLRAIFGMELVEWPARDETTMSVRERRKALKTKKQPTNTQTPAVAAAAAATRIDRYALESVLPDAYHEAAFTPLPLDNAVANPPAPDAAYIGFCTLVVALITLSGGEMSHADLEKYLSLLHGGRHGPVRADEDFLQPMAATMGDHIDDDDGGAGGQQQDGESTAQGGTLQHLVRQGYVVRVVEEATTAEGRGPIGGRGAGGSNGASAGTKVTWHVGPRGRLEIGPAQVASVVRHIYGQDADEAMERRLQSSLRAANKASGEKIRTGGSREQRGEAVVQL